MILEIATLNIIEGNEEAFEKDLEKASHLIASIPGYIKHSLTKCVEQPNKYNLLVEWDNIESHMVGFRESEAYKQWSEILTPHYLPERTMEHFQTVYEH